MSAARKLQHDPQPTHQTVVHYPTQRSRLEAIRRDEGYSVEELAEFLDITVKTIINDYLLTGIWKSGQVCKGTYIIYGGSVLDWILSGKAAPQRKKPTKPAKKRTA